MMNKIIFVGATLAIFALPGAFGLMCYDCTAMAPYNDSSKLCMMNNSYTPKNCTGSPNCTTAMIMVNNERKAYSAGCVPAGSNCTFYSENVCNAILKDAEPYNLNITCSVKCCQEDHCNMPKDFPTTTPPTTTKPSGNESSTEAPSAGVEFLAPKVIALLAAYLSALYFGKQ